MNYQSHSNERIGHGFFDMVKAVFCAKDRYYIWFTFGGCTAARWVVAGHIGSGGTYYMNGAGYIEWAAAGS